MIPALIRIALRYRWAVLATTVFIVGLGVWSFLHQQIDAYPDISAQMVQVITTYPGRAPEEVERQVTIPIEIAMRNVPRVETIRRPDVAPVPGYRDAQRPVRTRGRLLVARYDRRQGDAHTARG